MRIRPGSAHPWIVESETNIEGFFVEICRISYRPLAALIAASPDLLAACKPLMLQVVGELPELGYVRDNNRSRAAVGAIKAAIKKAEGLE